MVDTEALEKQPRSVSQARLLVLGRQGSGKGTQCTRLAEALEITHVSTGDLFRKEVARRSTLGKEVERYMTEGSLIPDDVVIDVVMNQTSDLAGWVLDGFPRTMRQGQALVEALGDDGVDLAIELEVPVHQVVKRLALRRVCDGCGTTSVASDDDDVIHICSICGGKVGRRPDDTVEAIEQRLSTYERLTGPLIDWLEGRNMLETVDGLGTADEVFQRLITAVSERLVLRIDPVDSTTLG